MRVFWLLVTEILLVLASAFAYYYWPRHLPLPKPQIGEKMAYTEEHLVILWPERYLIGTLAECEEATYAYLLFDYLRAQKRLTSKQVMLTVAHRPSGGRYRVLVRLPDDLLSGVSELAQLKADHLASRVEYAWITSSELSQARQDTSLFLSAYNDLNFASLSQISSAELQFYVRQFIGFKSATDPRTWKKTAFALSPVSVEEADRLATDILAVAEFYGIPVDLFLGIGAMENNFLSAPGDLNNALWKPRAQWDDIVLQQKGHQVWILNSSLGIWQITRQSLRHAQQLFLADQRDYSKLPQRLRPAQKLDLENLPPEVLTTYAGLLLRDLLDHFAGNVMMATGAYNGTMRHPNLRYAAGVEMVARYARRVIGNAAELSRLVASPSTMTQKNELAEVHAEVAVPLEQ